MSGLRIRGPVSLSGSLRVQGSKNGVLPVMAAAVLNRETVVIDNVPGIQDVFCMMGILDSLGCQVELRGNRLTVCGAGVNRSAVDKEQMGRMRSSIMLLGPLLGRLGRADISSPGGCSIGLRPIDLHRRALEAMGAVFEERDGELKVRCERLRGASIDLAYPSVGATENVIMAAVLAEGRTELAGAAREPEVEGLCRFLNGCGARIQGGGTGRICIEGVSALKGCTFSMDGDRIVAGTYLMAAAASGGCVRMDGVSGGQLKAVLDVLERAGARVRDSGKEISLKAPKRLYGIQTVTGPYPEFPTDLQSPLMALCATAAGRSVIEETVFEGRFKTADQLARLGASIGVRGRLAEIDGRRILVGGRVEATDLRGGAALVIGGLTAAGITYIGRREYIDRGYEDIVRDLRLLGADIEDSDGYEGKI